MRLSKALRQELAERLLLHVRRKYRTQKVAAKQWGVSEAFVSGVLRGSKAPTDAILADAEIGFALTSTASGLDPKRADQMKKEP